MGGKNRSESILSPLLCIAEKNPIGHSVFYARMQWSTLHSMQHAPLHAAHSMCTKKKTVALALIRDWS